MNIGKFTPSIGDGFEFVNSNGDVCPARIICVDVQHPSAPIAFLFMIGGIEGYGLADLQGQCIGPLSGCIIRDVKMRMLCDVIPYVGMEVISAMGNHGRVIDCTTKPSLDMYSDNDDDRVSILWNTGKVSRTYLMLMGNVSVKYSLPV